MSTDLLLLVLGWSGLAVLLGWRLPARWQLGGVAACGAGLLASVSPLSLVWLLAGTLGSRALVQRGPQRGWVLGVAVAGVALAYVMALATGPVQALAGQGETVLLPLGAAFYSLRLIHYLVASYKGSLRPHTLDELLAYQFLPGALAVGPIHRFDDFLRDSRRRRWDAAQCSQGLERVLVGVFKIVVIGGGLLAAKLAPALAETAAQPGLLGVYVSALLMWLPLYVVFSGCSDVALGSSAMLGWRLIENFNHPYRARNLADFWQRWHVSLAAWCRDHVFAPVLAWRRQPGLAVVASMVVLGLWHALSMHYLLWGLYHGLALALLRRWQALAPRLPQPPAWARRPLDGLSTLLTLHVVLLSFPITTAVEQALLRLESALP